MSGNFSNRSKKNGKKNNALNTSEVLQVKSLKLETTKSGNSRHSNWVKTGAKSEDNLRKFRKTASSKSLPSKNDAAVTKGHELEACLANKIQALSLCNEGVPSTSSVTVPHENGVPEYQDEVFDDATNSAEPLEHYSEADFYSYKFYSKNQKSIKFTNEVTVLYFNGDDILCESMEPLKKEIDQQIRNKEMRKEHLLNKGRALDNLYLF